MAETNRLNVDTFDLIYQSLNRNYDAILKNMASVSNMLKQNPENEGLKEILYSLSESAISIIGTQMSLLTTCEDRQYIANEESKLIEKRSDLLKAVSEDLANADRSAKIR